MRLNNMDSALSEQTPRIIGMDPTMFGPIATLLAVAAYGALHSLFASPPLKVWARHKFGTKADRFYRLAFNIIGTLTLIPVLAIPILFPGYTLYQVAWPWTLATSLGQAVAILLLAIGLLQTDVWHFLGLRQLLDAEGENPSKLVVGGLYRWVRHPLYTAGLVFIWLTPIMTTSTLSLFLGITLYIYIGSVFEERRLQAAFGVTYTAYRRCVPRLIPVLWRKPCPEIFG